MTEEEFNPVEWLHGKSQEGWGITRVEEGFIKCADHIEALEGKVAELEQDKRDMKADHERCEDLMEKSITELEATIKAWENKWDGLFESETAEEMAIELQSRIAELEVENKALKLRIGMGY